MKKNIVALSVSIISFGCLLQSCTVKDEEPPFMRLIGAADTSILLNSSFRDPGAYAKDNHDGLMEVQVSGWVNEDSNGVYVLSYQAVDSEKNMTELSRTVRVGNEIESEWAGTYNVQQGCTSGNVTYIDVVTASLKKNKEIIINLGNYSPSYNLSAILNLQDSTIRVPFQSRATGSIPLMQLNFQGEGTLNSRGFNINFTIAEVDTGGSINYIPCSALYER